eukprot:PhM_4_TR6551/c0_g1_i1/m.105164
MSTFASSPHRHRRIVNSPSRRNIGASPTTSSSQSATRGEDKLAQLNARLETVLKSGPPSGAGGLSSRGALSSPRRMVSGTTALEILSRDQQRPSTTTTISSPAPQRTATFTTSPAPPPRSVPPSATAPSNSSAMNRVPRTPAPTHSSTAASQQRQASPPSRSSLYTDRRAVVRSVASPERAEAATAPTRQLVIARADPVNMQPMRSPQRQPSKRQPTEPRVEATVESLRDEVQSLNKERKELESHHSDRVRELNHLTSEHAELAREEDMLGVEEQRLASVVAELKESVTMLEIRASPERDAESAPVRQIAELRCAVEQMDADVASSREAAASSERAWECRRGALREEVGALRSSTSEINEQVTATRSLLSKREADLRRLEEDRAAEAQRRAREREADEQAAANRTKEACEKRVQDAEEAGRRRVLDAQDELERLNRRITTEESDRATADERLREVRHRLEEVRLQSLDNDTARARLAEHQRLVSRWMCEASNWEEEVRRLEAHILRIEDEIEQFSEANERLSVGLVEASHAHDALDSAQKELDERESVLCELRVRHENARCDFEEQTRVRAAELRQGAAAADDVEKQLEAEVRSAEKSRDVVLRERDDLVGRIEGLREELQALDTELDGATKERAQLSAVEGTRRRRRQDLVHRLIADLNDEVEDDDGERDG